MGKYRKKPVVIEAWQWDGQTAPAHRPGWVQEAGCYRTYDGVLIVPTLEGEMLAHPSGWIVKGIKGEVYPVKPDIFAATYERADD